MTSQFPDMTSSSEFFDVVLFLLSNLVTGQSFTSVSSLVLELSQFSFIRDWPEIWKSKIPLSEVCPISGDWNKLWIPNLAQMSLTECYWMLQNSRVTAFTIFELLRENQLGGKISPHPPRLGLRGDSLLAITSLQEYLVLISSTSKGWKTESTLEPPSGFEPRTPGLRIQHLKH